MDEKLGDKLLTEQNQKEQSNYIFLDIETGRGSNKVVKQLRLNRIEKEIEREKYQWRYDWKEETNQRKEEEFVLQRPERITTALQKVDEMDAVNPFFNRIVIMGYQIGYETIQMDETEYTESNMINNFAKKIEEIRRPIIVAYSGFDISSIQLKAVRYKINLAPYNYIDVMKYTEYWPPFGRKEVLSQDILAAILDIKPNKHWKEIYPDEIGELFDNIKTMELTEEWAKQLYLYKQYNKEDIRVLKECFNVLAAYGVIR